MVREYILGKYDVPPQNVGFIGLADEATNSPDREHWDGAAVTLFLDRGELRIANGSR